MKIVEVAPSSAGGWVIRDSGFPLFPTFDTKRAAVMSAEEMCERTGGVELRICDRNGRTQRTRRYERRNGFYW